MHIIRSLLIALGLAILFLVGLYFLAPAKLVSLALTGERSAAGLKEKTAKIEGFDIVYLDSGGTGEPLVLIHGFASDKDSWNRVARTLSKHFRIIAPDMPGFGESSGPIGAHYTIEEQSARLHEFIAKLGLTHVHIGGLSMGGFIAARYAITYPNEVGSLWLIDNAGVYTAPPSELRANIASGKGNALIVKSTDDFRAMMNLVMNKPPFIPDAALDVLAQREIAAQDLRQKEFADINQSAGLEETIGGLPIPVHILWGKKDRALSVESVDILRKLLPNATATILPHIGHVPILEDPEATSADYLKFREGVTAASPVAHGAPE